MFQPTPEFFDLVIAIILIVGIIKLFGIGYILKSDRFSSRIKNLAKFSRAATAVVLILVVYGSFIEPRMITTQYETLNLCALHETCAGRDTRLVIVSDWHVGPFKQSDYVEKVVTKINEKEPTLVLMPGDFVYDTVGQVAHLAPLQNLHTEYGVYATLGNHDYDKEEQGVGEKEEGRAYRSDYIADALEGYGVNVLRNEQIWTKGDVTILGQEDWWVRPQFFASEFDIEAFEDDQDDLVILLQHNPDGAFEQDISHRIDLVISGHTHGGQVRLPIIGSLHPLPTEQGRGIDQGWFHIHDFRPGGFGLQKLFITRGIGETGPRSRLFAWPQIVVMDVYH